MRRMVGVEIVNRGGRGSFDTHGKTSPLLSRLSQPRPEIISIDEHTPVIDDINHEHRRALRLGEPHKLHLATNTLGESLREIRQTTHTWIVQD